MLPPINRWGQSDVNIECDANLPAIFISYLHVVDEVLLVDILIRYEDWEKPYDFESIVVWRLPLWKTYFRED